MLSRITQRILYQTMRHKQTASLLNRQTLPTPSCHPHDWQRPFSIDTSLANDARRARDTVEFRFMWKLLGLGDMTPPPLDPTQISVVPLSDLMTHTKEGGATPTHLDEVGDYLGQIKQSLTTNTRLAEHLNDLPGDDLPDRMSQYSRLSNMMVGQSNDRHFWLFKFVPFSECLREFAGPCLATICEERSMVLKHLMMHVKDETTLGVLDPFKPQEVVSAIQKNTVFVAREFYLNAITLNDNGDITDEIMALTEQIPTHTFVRNYVLLHWVLGDADFNNPGNFLIGNRLNARQGKALTSIDYGQILQEAVGLSGHRKGSLPDRQYISKTFEGGPDHFFERQCADGFNPMLGIIYNRLCNLERQAGVPASEIRDRVIHNMKTIRLRSGDQKRLGYKLDAIELFLNRIGLATHADHLAGLLRLQDPAPVTLYEIVTGHSLN
ncbi:MAG: hypothetical protein ACON35_08330 [Candidatus Marinamargulisbacteria bacterium]